MDTLRNEPFNQLIIVVEYGRASTDFYNHLEILERCLNGVVDRSVMLIINKVTNRIQIKRKAHETNNLEQYLNEMRSRIARVFNFQFSAEFSLLDEQNDDDEKENDNTLDIIRNFIETTEEYQFPHVKTWSELLNIYEGHQNRTLNKIHMNNLVINDLTDRIQKCDNNIENLRCLEEQRIRTLNMVSEFQGAAGDTIKKILKPVAYLSKKMLNKRDRTTDIRDLELKRENLQMRLNVIKESNENLTAEINLYLAEIERLRGLLRNN
jgi:hypothetical protein